MSALLENTKEDIEILEGATIEKVWIARSPLGFESSCPVVRLRVRWRDGFNVNGNTHGEFELWQDVEGNGPGYLSFVQDS
jgi:hypothetical protein